jgi:hypothetical protein
MFHDFRQEVIATALSTKRPKKKSPCSRGQTFVSDGRPGGKSARGCDGVCKTCAAETRRDQ